MGQTPHHPFSQHLQQTEVVFEDPGNNMSYRFNKTTNQHIMVRKWIFSQEQSQTQLKSVLGQRLSHPCPTMLCLKEMECSIHETPCNNYYNVDTLWEDGDITLKQKMSQKKISNEKFGECDMWGLIENCVLALAHLETSNVIHEKISTNSVVVVQSEFKLKDPLSMPCEDNYSLVFRNLNREGIYLSPQQCQALSTHSYPKKSNKDDVWALGVTVMEVGLQENQECCYLEDGTKINHPKIAENINKFGVLYGQKLKQIIQSMLQLNKKMRPNWSQLKQKLQAAKNPILTQKRTNATRNVQIDTRQSPDVFPYNSIINDTFSFSKPLPDQPLLTNPQSMEKQNLPFSKILVYPPPRPPVKFVKPFPNAVTFLPIEQMGSARQVPLQPKPNQNLNVSVSATHPHQLQKFRSITSDEGFLFSARSKPEEEVQATKCEPVCEKAKIQETRHIPLTSSEIPQKINNYKDIKNAESITYQGDFRPILTQAAVQQKQKPIEPQTMPTEPTLQVQEPQKEEIAVEQMEWVVENFSVGSRYEGYKLGNMRHGQGKFYFQDGGMYDGQWEQNKMSGKGRLYYQSGVLAYEGDWKNDEFEGKGKLYNESGDNSIQVHDYTNFDSIGECWEYYDGDFLNDFKEGRGKLMLTNGEYYVGNFRNDMIEGSGKFFSKNGPVKGQWQANRLIQRK